MRNQFAKYLFPAIDGLSRWSFLVLPLRKDRPQGAEAGNGRQDCGPVRSIRCTAWLRLCRERPGDGERRGPKLCNDIRRNRAGKTIAQLAEKFAEFDRSR